MQSTSSPGFFRCTDGYPSFEPNNVKLTIRQVWIRLYDLPLEFRKEQNLLTIAAGVRVLLQIDSLTLSLYHGLYASVLVEIDFLQLRPERILAKLRDEKSKLDLSFFVPVSYEILPKFCMGCIAFTHDSTECKKDIRGWNVTGEQTNRSMPAQREEDRTVRGAQRWGNYASQRTQQHQQQRVHQQRQRVHQYQQHNALHQ